MNNRPTFERRWVGNPRVEHHDRIGVVMAATIIEFDSQNSDEGAASDEARNKLGRAGADATFRVIESGPGPGFAAGGPLTHWVLETTT